MRLGLFAQFAPEIDENAELFVGKPFNSVLLACFKSPAQTKHGDMKKPQVMMKLTRKQTRQLAELLKEYADDPEGWSDDDETRRLEADADWACAMSEVL